MHGIMPEQIVQKVPIVLQEIPLSLQIPAEQWRVPNHCIEDTNCLIRNTTFNLCKYQLNNGKYQIIVQKIPTIYYNDVIPEEIVWKVPTVLQGIPLSLKNTSWTMESTKLSYGRYQLYIMMMEISKVSTLVCLSAPSND